MVMTSHQIGAVAMQQQAMFGNFTSYAQQITPPYGAAPGMGPGAPATPQMGPPPSYAPPTLGGYAMGPPPPPPPMMAPMPGYGMAPAGGMFSMARGLPYAAPHSYLSQAMGEQMLGSAFGGLESVASLGQGAWGMMGLAGAGMGMLGMTGRMGTLGRVAGLAGGMGGAGALLAGGVAIPAALGAAQFGAENLYAGFQERQAVNRVLRQRFGGVAGIGGGRGGMGFSTEEMGGISTMMRTMAGQDIFTNMEELTRVMDRTAEMGMYRGVRNAQQFRQKFQETVGALREVAQAMHTSLEGAAEFFEGQRAMGFFSGREITANLMRTRMVAGATGMSVQQMQQIGMQGTQMGRMMGMRGRQGARAMQEMAGLAAMGMRTGGLSDELVAEATGGLLGAEGAQAIASRQMQIGQRFFSRGAGRAVLAGLWDPESGGINQEALAQAAAGGMSFRQALGRGRANIRATGGRRSEFFSQQERIMGELMSSGQGMQVIMGMAEEHFGRRRGLSLEDPIMQRWLRRRLGASQSEIELFVRQAREMPRTLEQQRINLRQQLEREAVSRSREGTGLRGLQRRMSNWWEQKVENPIRQAADDLVTGISTSIDKLVMDMEGVVKVAVSERAKKAWVEFGRTGKSDYFMGANEYTELMGGLDLGAGLRRYEGGMAGGLGRLLGTRPQTLGRRLKKIGYEDVGSTLAEQQSFYNEYSRQLHATAGQMGFSSKEMRGLGEEARRVLFAQYGSDIGAIRGQIRDVRSAARRGGTISGKEGVETAWAFLEERAEVLAQGSPQLARALKKAKTKAQRAALLREIQRQGGLDPEGAFALPLEEIGAGKDISFYAANVHAIRAAREQTMQELSSAITGLDEVFGETGEITIADERAARRRKARRLFGREIGPRVVRAGKVTVTQEQIESGEVDISRLPTDVRDKILRQRGVSKALTSAMKSAEINELVTAAAMGNEGALRELQNISQMSDRKLQLRYGIGGKEAAALGALAAKAAADPASMSRLKDLARFNVAEAQLEMLQREANVASSLNRELSTNKRLQRVAKEVGALADLERITELRSKAADEGGAADWEEARRLEVQMYGRLGGQEGASALAAALTAEGGAGTYIGAGISRAAEVFKAAKGGDVGRLFEHGLRRAGGIDEGISGLGLGKAFKGRRGRQKLINMLRKGMTPEQLWEMMGGQARAQVQSGMGQEAFMERMGGFLEVVRGGVGDVEGEVAGLAGAEAAGAAWGGRAGGAGKERRSMTELATKQVHYLERMVKLQEKIAAQKYKLEVVVNDEGEVKVVDADGGDAKRASGAKGGGR